MNERQVIETQISKKQAEIDGLEDKIKAAKVYVAALRDVLKLMDKASKPVADVEDTETKLRAGSAVAQAREIILERGEPVYLDELLEAMGKEVTRDSKASLAGSLAAYVRREEIFSRPAPSTFGLIELGHFEVIEEEESPPPDFGGGRSQVDDINDDEIPF
ncbi:MULTISPECIES: hypothetical protein [unclassified Sphingobium]|uniref:hypothetical protein n=1 Tax=unclassified Sphingobium TaxID=2611147 RepID=UPI00222527D0|nr:MULTISPECIES: hypothetical protein [unclassified Sphingobium]MCW2395300.1 hypothetical protein [Sphingobium sp. B8D3B]MCW2418814.1 hypothetical protein [Sphingobium sp. B8D3C]